MPGPAQADVAGLLERELELQRLAAVIETAGGGVGSVVALEGEAGIGKTALLSHACRLASTSGMRVLSARGGELERDFAYGIVRQLFEVPLAVAQPAQRERWLAGAAGLATAVVSTTATDLSAASNPASVLHGLYWLSANLSLDHPLLLAIDDAHWADDASIAFMSYLARRVDELAVLIVYASRSGEGASDALPSVAEPASTAMALRPGSLSESATATLVAQELSAPVSPRFSRACHTATSGNPFLLGELLRALADDDVTPDDTNTERVDKIAPGAIARATLTRLQRLGPDCTALAFAVAVLGRSAELRHAAQLAALDLDLAADAADALAMAAILRDGRPLEFVHPIVRTTIYDELAPGRRAASHKRAARMLADDGVGDVALAPHLLATEPGGDGWVVERLRAAARDVLEQAPSAACTYLERADREPAAPADRHALLLSLGEAELIVGKTTAVERLREALDRAPDAEARFAAAQPLSSALTWSGRLPEAIELGNELLAGAPPADIDLKLRLEGDLALIAQFAPAYAKAAVDGLAGYAGTLSGKTHAERLILTCLAFGAAHSSASAAETADLADLALGGGKLVDEHRTGSAALFLAVWALIYADRLDDAERHFDRALKIAARRGWEGEFAGISGSHGHVLVRQGRLAEAEAEALSVLATVSLHAIARAMLLSCLLHTMAERTDPRTWQPFLAEHDLDGDLSGRVMGGMLLYSRGQLRLAAGDARGALEDFDELHRRDELSGLHTPAIPSSGPRALAHLQLGDRDAARTLADDELEQARRWGAPSALAYALRAAGLVAGGSDGIELLRDSVTAVQHSSAHLEYARSLTDFGAALRRAGHRRDAQPVLRQGLDVADRCGALRLAGRAREELVATGARPRRAALSGRDALTPSERRVAQLAVDGLGNREIAQTLFVTVRTVEGHLTNTYIKLNISARSELAAALTATAGG
jgi:DNA-binding CsgD family transcriptional regulator